MNQRCLTYKPPVCRPRKMAVAAACLIWLTNIAHVPEANSMDASKKSFFESGHLDVGLAGSCALPNLARSPDGVIFCTFALSIQSIWITSTRDAGQTWSKPVKVMECPGKGYIADPNILAMKDRVTVFATFVPQTKPRRFARSQTLASNSDDGGRTWSKPTQLPIPHKYVCGKVHVPISLDDGTIAMGYSYDVPAEEGRPAGNEGGMFLRAGLLLSKDGGKTWTPGGDAKIDIFPIGADEPAIVQLKNGKLFMVLRTSSQRPYETRSHDRGQSWDPPKPSTFYGHNSPTALLRLQDGAILRVWDNSSTNRFPLVASISSDECETWSPPRTITEPSVDSRGRLSYLTACYPSIAQADDGTILVVWWERTNTGSRVGWARFNRAWVEEGRNEPPATTVVAFGDSVTVGVRPGVTEYQTFRHLLERRLRAAGQRVRIINAGIGGSNTRDALKRMERDVLAARPALVIIMFGVNDAAMVDGGPKARTTPRVPLDEYRSNLTKIVRRVQSVKAKVVLCTPTPMSRAYVYSNIGAYATHDINFMLTRYAQAAREVAQETGVPLVDLFDLFMQRPDGLTLIKDGNHPYAEGHSLIVEALFEPVRTVLRGNDQNTDREQ